MERSKYETMVVWLQLRIWMVAATCGVAFGLLLGFIAFAKPSSGDVVSSAILLRIIGTARVAMNDSSLAEWISAVGAVAIGYAALRFQHASAVRAEAESAARSLLELNARISSLTSIKRRVRRAYAVGFQTADSMTRGEVSRSDVASQLRITLPALHQVVWSEADKALLNSEIVDELAILELRVVQNTVVCEEARDYIRGLDGNELDDQGKRWVTVVVESAKELRDCAGGIETAIQLQIAGIRVPDAV